MVTHPTAPVLQRVQRRQALRAFYHVARRKYLATASAFMILLLILVAIFAPVIAPYDPIEVDTPIRLQAPQLAHLMGTDELGRDIFSRIIFGSRVSLLVGLSAVTIGLVVGLILGLTSAYFGGRYDLLIQRFIDAWQAFPGLILALVMVAILGQSLLNVIIAISFTGIASKTRVIRGTALSVLQNDYVTSARACGCTDVHIMLRYVLANSLAPIFVVFSITVGGAILQEASLSFLGLGPPPPDPTWGAMVSGSARQLFNRAPWMLLAPGLAITMVVMSFNLLGDGLRDILDPRLRGSR